MTEYTLLDWVFLGLLVSLVIGLWGMGIEYLNTQDRQANKDTQCPPHQWSATHISTSSEEKWVGFKCAKCGRTPNGLSKGQSWTIPF